MSLQMIQTLVTTIEAKDEYTRGHSHRVAEYSALIAKELGWKQKDIFHLYNAAHLHDIGNIGIPDAILNKPARLTDEEYAVIERAYNYWCGNFEEYHAGKTCGGGRQIPS